jgi:hypothetical protein
MPAETASPEDTFRTALRVAMLDYAAATRKTVTVSWSHDPNADGQLQVVFNEPVS